MLRDPRIINKHIDKTKISSLYSFQKKLMDHVLSRASKIKRK